MIIEEYLPNFARVFGALVFLPLDHLGFTKKISLAATISVCLGPKAEANLLCEFLLGVFIAIPVVLIMDSLVSAAELFDTARGQTIDVMYAPNGQHNDHSLQLLVRTFVVVLFFLSDASLVMLRSVITAPELDVTSIESLGRGIGFAVQEAVSLMLFLVLPFAAVCATVEYFLGWASKVLPQLSLYNEAFFARMISGCLFLLGLFSAERFDQLTELLRSAAKATISFL
jgi:flagellar biosynthesis protein FliR